MSHGEESKKCLECHLLFESEKSLISNIEFSNLENENLKISFSNAF